MPGKKEMDDQLTISQKQKNVIKRLFSKLNLDRAKNVRGKVLYTE